MEMTDRRPIIASAKASLHSTATGDEENGSRWCKVEHLSPVEGTVDATSNNGNGPMSLSRIKRTHLIMYLLAAFSLFHLQNTDHFMSAVDPAGGSTVFKEEKFTSITITVPENEPQPSPSPPPSFARIKSIEPEASLTTKETPIPEPTSTTPDKDKNYESDVNIDDEINEIDTAPSTPTTIIEEEKTPHNVTQQNVTQQNVTQQNITKGEKSSDYEENETDNDVTQSDGMASTIPPAKSNHTDANSHHSPIARNFVDTHCDLTHLKDEAWYPSGPEDDWQLRAPYLIVAGVWNAGVNQLATALLKHPQIDAAKQNGFFLPKQFSRYYDIQTSDKNVVLNTNNNQTAAESTGSNFNVKVFAARERMYAQAYSKTTLRENKSSNDEESPAETAVTDASDENNNNTTITKNQHVAMDISPGLIFYAHKTAHSILCTTPWVKIVVLLRNPIDRLYRQWSYSVKNLNLQLSLEDWMAQEMKLLQSVGMISGSDEADKEQQPTAEGEPVVSEKDAWEKYQSVHNVAGVIGRSLYVFQLEEWIQAYISAGKKPSEEIIILTTEDIEENPEHEYAELIQFLGLPPATLNDESPSNNDADDGADSVGTALGKSLLQKQDATPMTEETRKILLQFFKPYNKRLTELLTSNGFEGDWDKRWR